MNSLTGHRQHSRGVQEAN